MDWSTCAPGGVATLACIPGLIATIISWALTFSGVVATLFIIIAGYKYITSHGDSKKIEEARKTLVYALLGLIVIFVSFFIVHSISTITGVGCINPNNTFTLGGCS